MAVTRKLATLREVSFIIVNWLACTELFMGFWRVLFTIILPPLGVLLGKGLGWAFILNILLTILGYFPGLIHAFWVQTKS